MNKGLKVVTVSVLLIFCSIATAWAAPKSLKALETKMKDMPMFMSGEFQYFAVKDLNKVKKDLNAVGYVNGFDFVGNEGFSKSLYVVEFKGASDQAKVKKFWKALSVAVTDAGKNGSPAVVTKGRYAILYFKGGVPDAAITDIKNVL
jgi:hypothetical protein